MKNPCITCITLAICKAKASSRVDLFLPWVWSKCELYRNYIVKRKIKRENIFDFYLDLNRANELGKLFGYEISEKGIYREKSV